MEDPKSLDKNTKDGTEANTTSAAEMNQLAIVNVSNDHHIRPHMDEKLNTIRTKKWACEIPNCFKSFDRANKLTDHTNTHTGKKPFTCKAAGCTKSFHTRPELTRHIRRFCKFLNPETFNDHARPHTEAKLDVDACQITDSSYPNRPVDSNPHNSDVKIYGSAKYERMTKGPFLGKVASYRIITIDGEEYIEYGVLLKPSLFF